MTSVTVTQSPLRCRHRWGRPALASDEAACTRCGAPQDPTLSHRGKSSARLGKDQERRIERTVVVIVPGRPPSPNRQRVHWRTRHRTDQQWRATAGALARNVLDREWPGPMLRARLDVLHVVPDRRARDLDNLAAALKPCLDGIVDAGVIADDRSTVLVEVTHRVEHRSRVAETRFTFTEVVES